jgi:hypothetical protein
MYPSLTETTLFINASSCTAESASCPLPVTGMWGGSAAQNTNKQFNSSPFNITSSSWDNITSVIGMNGDGHFIFDRIQICGNCFMDGVAVLSGDDVTVSYPGGASYKPDVSFVSELCEGESCVRRLIRAQQLSLYDKTNTFSWKNTTGQKVTGNGTLFTAFSDGYIPSISYGLHVGSVYPNVTPSLYWGGYDSSRLLGPPITSNTDTFTLRDISLTVSSGGGAYLNNSANSTIPIFSGSSSPLTAKPDPGPPYLYLPQSVCDAIATHLPVSFNKDFNLYTWDTSSSAYTEIISSPHAITFTFDSAIGSGTNINVPFALLNLTLDYPLASPSVQYFPCSPYSPSSGSPYILGRAFLQAAFIGNAWDQKKLFLAQAPGPSVQAPSIKTIGTSDVALSSWVTTPTWEQTWALTLQALPGTFNNTTPTPSSNETSSGSSGSTNKSSGISGGAIAGIVVGVVALLLILAAVGFFMWRRKKRNQGPAPPPRDEPSQQAPVELSGTPQIQEKSAVSDQSNKYKKYASNGVEGSQEPPAELPGHDVP